MVQVHTLFDCKHEADVEISIEPDVVIPEQVRGLGKCPTCIGDREMVPVPGVDPGPGGRNLVLDSILIIPLDA